MPLSCVSSGLGSNRSTCDGPPCMKQRDHRVGARGEVRRLRLQVEGRRIFRQLGRYGLGFLRREPGDAPGRRSPSRFRSEIGGEKIFDAWRVAVSLANYRASFLRAVLSRQCCAGASVDVQELVRAHQSLAKVGQGLRFGRPAGGSLLGVSSQIVDLGGEERAGRGQFLVRRQARHKPTAMRGTTLANSTPADSPAGP